jgi:hypothetical protein
VTLLERSRPAGNGPANESLNDDATTITTTLTPDQRDKLAIERARRWRRDIGRPACPHLCTAIPCGACLRSGRRTQAALRAAEPVTPRQPSAVRLTECELRRQGNRLVIRHAWAVAEVRQVLAVECRPAA